MFPASLRVGITRPNFNRDASFTEPFMAGTQVTWRAILDVCEQECVVARIAKTQTMLLKIFSKTA
jgi:hypothetical protein